MHTHFWDDQNLLIQPKNILACIAAKQISRHNYRNALYTYLPS